MPPLPSRWAPAARADLIEQVAYYEEQRPLLGQRFAVAVRASLRRLADFPLMGRLRDPAQSGGPRVHRVQGFPFKLIYRVEAEQLVILAVAHERRGPG